MFTDKSVDSRNIAGFEIILIVEDVHDTPPIFTRIDPTIQLPSNLTQVMAIIQRHSGWLVVFVVLAKKVSVTLSIYQAFMYQDN